MKLTDVKFADFSKAFYTKKKMEKTKLELTSNEALVLVDFLLRYRDEEKLIIQDQAEEQLLWDLCAMLEPEIPELLHKDYKLLLEKAREVVKSGNEIE